MLGRGKAELHFYGDREVDPLSTTAMCSLYVDNSQALFEEWSTIIVPDERTGSRMVAPQATDCGMREFAVVERSGNLLRIGSAIDRYLAGGHAIPPGCRVPGRGRWRTHTSADQRRVTSRERHDREG